MMHSMRPSGAEQAEQETIAKQPGFIHPARIRPLEAPNTCEELTMQRDPSATQPLSIDREMCSTARRKQSRP
jgi:hypothetical protein